MKTWQIWALRVPLYLIITSSLIISFILSYQKPSSINIVTTIIFLLVDAAYILSYIKLKEKNPVIHIPPQEESLVR